MSVDSFSCALNAEGKVWLQEHFLCVVDQDQDEKPEVPESKDPVEVKPSKLEVRVKEFIHTICSLKMMNQMMMEIG